jgi:hypothetical protein
MGNLLYDLLRLLLCSLGCLDFLACGNVIILVKEKLMLVWWEDEDRVSVGVSVIASDNVILVRVTCSWASEASFGCSSAGGSFNVGLGLALLCSLTSNLRSICITAVYPRFLWELFFFLSLK